MLLKNPSDLPPHKVTGTWPASRNSVSSGRFRIEIGRRRAMLPQTWANTAHMLAHIGRRRPRLGALRKLADPPPSASDTGSATPPGQRKGKSSSMSHTMGLQFGALSTGFGPEAHRIEQHPSSARRLSTSRDGRAPPGKTSAETSMCGARLRHSWHSTLPPTAPSPSPGPCPQPTAIKSCAIPASITPKSVFMDKAIAPRMQTRLKSDKRPSGSHPTCKYGQA